MKKNFKIYLACWGILLALFNLISFVAPAVPGAEKFTASFWIGYVGITLALVGNLVCGYYALKSEDSKKLFYNLPLLTLGYAAIVLTFIFGGVCMLVSVIPEWVGVIVCCIIVALYAVAILKASAAAEVVADVDSKIKVKTFFIKTLTVDAETLLSKAKSDEAKEACNKVFEAVRYSDPMSNEALAGVESQITLKFNELSEAVSGGADNVSKLADDMVVLVGDRNRKCKLLK